MNEVLSARVSREHFRRSLLASASAMVLFMSVYARDSAMADDTKRPAVWIELGGQLERIDDSAVTYSPTFETEAVRDGFSSPAFSQRPPRYSNGAEGRISLEPDGSDWIFSASIRYGRSNGSKHIHEQSAGGPIQFHIGPRVITQTPSEVRFADTDATNGESHAVLDFGAGKDVGLGAFGHGGQSVIAAGVRFAQFHSAADATLRALPNLHFFTQLKYVPGAGAGNLLTHHSYLAAVHRVESFRGVGPSISWNASLDVAGDPQDREITLDWGLNGALLFGRQKAHASHQINGYYYKTSNVGAPHAYHGLISQYHHTATPNRSRGVFVPNAGGFAGVSARYRNAKISLGYRGDFFFGAMDGGIDTRKSESESFFGPFATISIGLGG